MYIVPCGQGSHSGHNSEVKTEHCTQHKLETRKFSSGLRSVGPYDHHPDQHLRASLCCIGLYAPPRPQNSVRNETPACGISSTAIEKKKLQKKIQKKTTFFLWGRIPKNAFFGFFSFYKQKNKMARMKN